MTNPVIRKSGNKIWYNEKGKFHRDDGPAIEWADGTKSWFKNGNRHRLDGPAVEYANGDKYWYIEEVLHRDNGPAIECYNGDKAWYKEGKITSIRRSSC